MAEGTSVGSIFLDLIVRDTVEAQVRKIASKGQAVAQQAFSGVDKMAEKTASNIATQVNKPVEKLANTVSQSAQKLASGIGKASTAPLEKSLQKAQEQAEKTKNKVQALEAAISALDEAKDIRIAEEVRVFSESVETAQKNVDRLKERISSVKATMAAKSGQSFEKELAILQGKLLPALQTLKVEREMLYQQIEVAEKNMASTIATQQEKLYGQLATAREQLAVHNQKLAEMQSAAEIAAAKQTTAVIMAEEAKQTAAQATSSDTTAAVRAQMHAFAEAVRADAQKMIDDSAWNRLSNFAKTFGEIAVNAFSEAKGSAVSFGNIASQAFSKAGGVAGLFGSKVGMIITIAKTAGNAIAGIFTKAISKVKETFSKAKTVISKVGTAVNKLPGQFNSTNKSAHRFESRLREIASSALLFNGIGVAMRGMVSYFSETISSTDEMKDALANLKGAAANAASPIIQVLTPALTALTNAAATALSYVSRLVTMLTGKVSNAAATATKSAEKAAGAAKKASRSLAGFDQIERLGGDTSGSGNSSEDGSDAIEPNYDFKGFSPFLESILEDIQNSRWAQIGEKIAEQLNGILSKVKWDEIQNKAKTWTQNIVDTLNGFVHKIDFDLVGKTLGQGLDTITTSIDTYFQGINWKGLGKGFADGLEDLLNTVGWEQLGRVLTDGLRAAFEWLHGFVANFNFSKLGTKIGEMLKAALGNINWPQLAEDLNSGMLGLLDTLIAFTQQIEWDKVRQTISDCFDRINWGDIGKKIGDLLRNIEWSEIIGSVWELISELWKAKWETLGAILWECIKEIGKGVVKHFKEVGLNGIQGFLNGIKNPVSTIANWLSKNLVKPLVDAVCKLLGIQGHSTVFAEIGKKLTEGLLNGISETWNSITEFFDEVFGDIKDSFSQTWDDIYSGVSEITQDIYREISTAFTNVKDRVTTIWNGISSTIKGAINGIIGFINGMISGIVNGINTVTRALNKLSFTVPDWLKHVPGASNIAGKKFGFNISTITAPQIPYLADGGVISQPTLAMMGEYAGARNNPEIVAPQSVMAETVAAVMEDVIATMMTGFEALLDEQRLTRQAVESIEVGDEIIGQATARYSRKMAVVTGGR